MLFRVKLNSKFPSFVLEEAKVTSALSLLLFAAKKDTSVLTGAGAACKERLD